MILVVLSHQPRDLRKVSQLVRGEITDLLFDGHDAEFFVPARPPPIGEELYCPSPSKRKATERTILQMKI
jgi:hypothetical protein